MSNNNLETKIRQSFLRTLARFDKKKKLEIVNKCCQIYKSNNKIAVFGLVFFNCTSTWVILQ